MNVAFIILKDGTKIVSQVDKVDEAELGEPDVKLIDPVSVFAELNPVDGIGPIYKLTPWLNVYTDIGSFKIHSDFIMTMAPVNKKLYSLYLKYLSYNLEENPKEDNKVSE